ncbi:MAG: hypothetical protein ABR601_01085, partial [Parasphingopyxis sp.]
AGASTSPSFDLAVLNTEKFQRGILRPLTPALLGSFLDQGWNPDVIAAMLIERIDFVFVSASAGEPAPSFSEGEIVATFVNRAPFARDADDPDGESCFRRYFNNHVLSVSTSASSETQVARWSDISAETSLADLELLDGNAFDIDLDADRVNRLSPRRAQLRTTNITRDDGPLESCLREQIGLRLTQSDSARLRAPASVEIETRPAALAVEDGEPENKVGTFRVEVNGVAIYLRATARIRSVQGAFYFAGELIRDEEGPIYRIISRPTLEERARGETEQHISLIRIEVGSPERPLVATTFNGQRYSIPESAQFRTRSLQVLALLQQLLNLQKSADELPTTQSVTVVR